MYSPPYSPYKHQITARQRTLARPDHPAPTDVFALLMEQGTGKTKVLLDEFGEREDAKDLRNMLIIAPRGAYMNWLDTEIPMHLSDDLKERTLIKPWISSAGVTYKRTLERFLRTQDRPRILAVNVESLSVVQAAVDMCQEFIGQRRTMIVVDESTRIKGLTERSARARNVITLGERGYVRRIATGLVTPRSPLDLYSQFEFLDWRILGFRSYYSFRSRYAIIENVGALKRGKRGQVLTDPMTGAVLRQPMVVGYCNEDELRARIAPYSYRVLKEDCLDLPPKVYMPPRAVPLTDEQARILKELKATAQAQLATGEFISSKMRMTTLLRMQQVLCGHVKDEDGKEHPIKSNRIRSMMEVIEEQEGKIIIWSGFIYSIKEIIATLRKEYGPQSVVHYYGATKDKDRTIAKRRFQEDPICRFFVANQESAGLALTLTQARLCLYYSNTWDLEDRLQSEDRPHRSGLTHSVTYMDLMAEGTMEMKQIKSLRKKLDLATIINGDSYREWII